MSLNVYLHTHSFFSGDGVSSPEDLIAAARAKGLSGIAITDHNTCDAVNYLLEKGLMRLDGLPVNDFLVLPGVEITTADGHLLRSEGRRGGTRRSYWCGSGLTRER